MIDGLIGVTARVARELIAAFPGAKIVSGKRTVQEQALAMARNVVRNRNWIAETYRAPLCRAARLCHEQSQAHPSATAGELAWLFTNVLSGLPPEELRKLSRHPTGEAIDVLPGSDAMRVFLHDAAVRHGAKFLTSEGGLDVWHWEAP